MKHLIAFSVLFTLSNTFATSISIEQVERELKGPGAIGWVHGSVPEYDQFVFTYRNPDNFFDHLEFPLTTENLTVKEELKKLGRHDEVKVKGSLLDNKAPIKHISVEEVTVVKKFENPINHPPYQHAAKLPGDLLGKTELVGKVHAVVDDGKILVIEYKDAIVPVYVRDNKYTKGLYRNDKIRLQYVVKTHPSSPSHVMINTKSENPLVVTDRVVDIHGKKGSVEGFLILFPKSPQVLFNVFALQVPDALGIKREFTLVNFDDPKVFEAIRIKLQEFWDKNPGGIKDARNKFINLNVRLKATGTFNVVDPGQANPQVILSGPESITVVQ